MKKISETVVFFGSGPVAAASLEYIAENFNVEAVITKPRALHHRGSVPVIELADKLALSTFTVSSKQELDSLLKEKSLRSRLGVLIDFGIIVSQEAIDAFPCGIINSHFSLLPEWRGADPITFSILSGQQQTGVSLMLLSAGMDEGLLLAQTPYQLPSDITTPVLTADLVELSNALIGECISPYLQDDLLPVDQMSASLAGIHKPTYSRKITKQDGILDPTKSAIQLEREIRAFIEWPKTHTRLGDVSCIITQAHVIETQGAPGSRLIIDGLPVINCGHNGLAVDRLKPVGKQEMTGQAFLAGYRKNFLENH